MPDTLHYFIDEGGDDTLFGKGGEWQTHESGYAYHKKSLYDELVRQLFNKFHRIAYVLDITFSERGSSDRTKAFEKAINQACRDVAGDKKNHTRDLGGTASTSQVGDTVCAKVA